MINCSYWMHSKADICHYLQNRSRTKLLLCVYGVIQQLSLVDIVTCSFFTVTVRGYYNVFFKRQTFSQSKKCIASCENELVIKALQLNPLQPRMFCAKFGLYWLSGSGGEDFKISSMYFHHFIIISPWNRAGPFIWTNLNEKKIWSFRQCIFTIS